MQRGKTSNLSTTPAQLLRLAVLGGALLAVLLMASCRHHTAASQFNAAHRNSYDSIVMAQNDPDSLLSLLERYNKNDEQMGEMVVCRQLGKVYRDRSNFNQAIAYHRKGTNLATILADTIELVKSLNNLGTDYRRLGIYDIASQYHYNALQLCMEYSDKESAQTKKNRVVSLNGLGNVYLTLGNGEQADSVFREALKGEKELDSPLGQAINYANIGSIFEDKGQLDSAWTYYRLSMQMNVVAESDLGVSLCYTHYGRLYEKQRQYDDAIKQYETAYNLMEKNSDEWHWLESALSLAHVYILKANFAQAQEYLDKALNVAVKIESKEHLERIYRLYYDIYRQRGDTANALACFIKANEYRDSVVNLKALNDMQNMRINIERQRKQEEINLVTDNLRLERQSKVVAYVALTAVLLAALVSIALLWYVLRSRTRKQRVMRQMQNEREQFFTNITHEFRTPLTVIMGSAQLMQKDPHCDPQKILSTSNTIVNQSHSLLHLVNQLLDISKVKSAIGEAQWYHGNIVAFVHMAVQNFQQYAKEKRIDLKFFPMQETVNVDFIPDYLDKVMRNLLANAIKFTPAGGQISVTTDTTDQRFILRVADNGLGMSSEVKKNLFKPFYQGPDDSHNIGTGIGLSLVYQIIKSIKGDIRVESTLGQGTTFHISVPLKQNLQTKPQRFDEAEYAINEAATPRPTAATAVGAEPSPDWQANAWRELEPPLASAKLAQQRILVVEDNQDIAAYIGSLLPDSYSISYANNGREGLEKARQTVPNLIITDLMMPESDGIELCRMIRHNDDLGHIPIIIVSAKSSEEDRLKAIRAGADAYLLKPFNQELFLATVEKSLQQQQRMRQKYEHEPLHAQPVAHSSAQPSADEQQLLNKVNDAVFALIKQNKLDADALATTLGMSKAQLSRRLTNATGLSTATYILQLRINYAKRLIDSDVNMPISEVAHKCGYDDLAYFSRIFKQNTRMTPSQYRKRMM